MKQTRAIRLGALNIALAAALGISTQGCGNDFLGLEDYQRDVLGVLLAGALGNQPTDTGGDPAPGQPVPGEDGVNCWDRNGNGVGDPEEDANGDGIIDPVDALWVLWAASGQIESPPNPANADWNGDGSIDGLDALGILQFHAGFS